MTIKQHYHLEGTLQRSIVIGSAGTLYRRIARRVTPAGELAPLTSDLPLWQQQIHTGEWHTVLNVAEEKDLEREFIDELLR